MKALVIPAAGRGSRLQFDGPKALFPVFGVSMLERIIFKVKHLFDAIIVVINPKDSKAFEEVIFNRDFNLPLIIAHQSSPTGSLDAVKIGLESAFSIHGVNQAVVVWCDQLGVSESTVKHMLSLLELDSNSFVMPTIETSYPYVWLIFSPENKVVSIGRARDGDSSPTKGVADLGVFGFERAGFSMLTNFQFGDRNRENDFTYAIPRLLGKDSSGIFFSTKDLNQLIAINELKDLLHAEIVCRND